MTDTTDMTAFERQLSGEIAGLMGPVRPVDDAAIFAAITATQSPKRRVQTMFGAARIAVAAAIVALSGGFLVAGLLTAPRGQDISTTGASPSPMTIEQLLSGMVTEEVEPGVYRILDDGAGHDLVAEPPVGLTVASDGSVWLLRRSQPPDIGDWADLHEWVDAVIRLGQSGTYSFQPAEPSRADIADLAIGPDSVAWTTIGSTRPEPGMLGSLDGSTWSHPTWPDGSADVAAIEATSDGSIWVTQQVEDGPGPRVARIVDGEWTVLPTLEDPALTGFFHGADRYFAAAPDGTAWLANGDFHRCSVAPAPQGLLHFDGTRWQDVDILGDGEPWLAGPLALGSDGTLWVYLERPSGCGPSRNSRPGYLARLDGEGPRLFTAQEDGVPRMLIFGWRDADLAVDAAGTLWVGHYRDGVLAFDGSSWRQYLADKNVSHVGVTPQGSVLAILPTGREGEPYVNGSEAGLYVITPEAAAATE